MFQSKEWTWRAMAAILRARSAEIHLFYEVTAEKLQRHI
jgi:hypothetical protein